MQLLNIKPRSFYRVLEKIRKEDYFDLMTDRKGSLAVAVNLTRDRLSRILGRLETIANNGTAENPMGCTPNEMTNASSQASMVRLALLKLEVEGPTIVHTDKLHEIMSSAIKMRSTCYTKRPGVLKRQRWEIQRYQPFSINSVWLLISTPEN